MQPPELAQWIIDNLLDRTLYDVGVRLVEGNIGEITLSFNHDNYRLVISGPNLHLEGMVKEN